MDDRTKTERPEVWPGPITRPGEPVPPSSPPSPPTRRRSRPRGFLTFLIGLALIGGAAWWIYQHHQAPQPARTRASRSSQTPPVTPATVQTGDINVTINALGTVTSLATVTVRSQIS